MKELWIFFEWMGGFSWPSLATPSSENSPWYNPRFWDSISEKNSVPTELDEFRSISVSFWIDSLEYLNFEALNSFRTLLRWVNFGEISTIRGLTRQWKWLSHSVRAINGSWKSILFSPLIRYKQHDDYFFLVLRKNNLMNSDQRWSTQNPGTFFLDNGKESTQPWPQKRL